MSSSNRTNQGRSSFDHDEDHTRSESSSSRQSVSRRSQTPKVTRKILNRSVPYDSASNSHSIGQTNSTISLDPDRDVRHNNVRQELANTDFNLSSMATTVVQQLSQRDESSANAPFEKSSDDDIAVSQLTLSQSSKRMWSCLRKCLKLCS